MKIFEVNGIPVLLRAQEFPPYRFKLKKKKRKGYIDPRLKRLTPKQKKALELKAENPLMPDNQIGKIAGFHPTSASQSVKRALRKSTKLHKTLDKEAPDEKIGKELARIALNSEHPLSKGNRPDNMARLGGIKEINKIRDPYPIKEIHFKGLVGHVDLTPDDHEAYHQYIDLVQEENEQEGA